MTTGLRAVAGAGAALATIGALVIASPTSDVNPDLATDLAASPVSTAFQLVSKDNYVGKGNSGRDDDDDDDDEYYSDDDDDDDGGFGAGIGSFITDFLANNQADVLAVTAMIPVIYLGPVAVGNSLLANAYYNGYGGSAAGVEGVLSYVASQIGVPPADLVQGLVLSVTSMIPQFNIGPVAVGNAVLATAYFDGYEGSATGLPGVVSYVTSQLGVQAAPAAVTVSAVTATSNAIQSDDAPVSRTAVSVPASVASQDSDITAVSGADKPAETDSVADVDPAGSTAAAAERNAGDVSTTRSTGRAPAAAKAGSLGGQSKARSARSASARSGGES
jgi:hypothetical protein